MRQQCNTLLRWAGKEVTTNRKTDNKTVQMFEDFSKDATYDGRARTTTANAESYLKQQTFSQTASNRRFRDNVKNFTTKKQQKRLVN